MWVLEKEIMCLKKGMSVNRAMGITIVPPAMERETAKYVAAMVYGGTHWKGSQTIYVRYAQTVRAGVLLVVAKEKNMV